MENIISFFTETLSGTTYVIVVVIAVILFFACIGYLAERSILRKKKEEQYVSVSNPEVTQSIKDPVVNHGGVQTVVTPHQEDTLQSVKPTIVNPGTNVTPIQQGNPVTPQVVPEIAPVAKETKPVVTPTVEVNTTLIPNTPTSQNVAGTPPSNTTLTAIPEIQLPPNTTSQ